MVEPHDWGLLYVGDGQQVYWESCGNPEGVPAVVLHGGPGTGCTPVYRTFFDLERYRVVLFDQRSCGRSVPHAGDPATDLSVNTTAHLLADVEALRRHVGIDRWLVFGLSWGSTLGLVYAQTHPERVSGVVVGMVVGGTRREVRWITRDIARLFPAAWARLRDGVRESDRDGDLAAAYSRLLESGDPQVREQAAQDWCAWEDTHVAFGTESSSWFENAEPRERLAFARLVTHYWSNGCFLEEGQVLRDADRLAGTPGVLVHGRLDVSSPVDVPWELHQRWPDSDLVIVDEGGHSTGEGMGQALTVATRDFLP